MVRPAVGKHRRPERAAGLALLKADLPLPAAGAFTSRAGGVSAPPWDALNLALHVGDDPDRVAANRRRLAAALDVPVVVFAEQVHGAQVGVVDGATPPDGGVPGVDALVTGTSGVALAVLAADCLPVLLADPGAGVVAAVHAGRAGLAAGVLQRTLEAMAGLGATPAGTTAVIGPAICGLCYELPAALADEVAGQVPGVRSRTRTGTPSVDLAAGAHGLLSRSGVGVRRTGGCTAEQPARFFSYRRDGRTGRHAGVVRLL